MASIRELVASFQQGILGKALAKAFNGRIGHVYPNQDSDLIIEFSSEEQTPSVEQIAQVITRLFTGAGYTVLRIPSGKNAYEANIFVPGQEIVVPCVYVNISTRYPHDHRVQFLRLTTEAHI